MGVAILRCVRCGAQAEAPRPGPEVARLYHQLAPFLRVQPVRPVPDRMPMSEYLAWTAEGARRHRYFTRERRGLTAYVGHDCQYWPLHAQPDERTRFVLAWGDRARPGQRPSYHQFCQAYGLRVAAPVVLR